MRAAAQAAMARSDADSFMPVLSGLDNDRDWSVRAALATTLGTLSPEAAGPRLAQLAADPDPEVIAAALRAMTTLKMAGAEARPSSARSRTPIRRCGSPLPRGSATLKPAGAAAALATAYEASRRRTRPTSLRAALLAALAAVEGPAAAPRLTAALSDPDWAVRVRAAALLRRAPGRRRSRPVRLRPTPTPALEAVDQMVAPAGIAAGLHPHQPRASSALELAVLDAPRTVANFIVAGPARASSTACGCTAWCPTSSCRTAIRAATAKADPATRSATS